MPSAMKTTRIGFVLSCAAGLAGSLWLGYEVRFNFAVPEDTERTFPLVCAWLVAFKLLCLWRLRQFDAFLGYFSLPDFSRLAWVLFATSLLAFGVSTQLGSDYAPPRGVVLGGFSFSLLALTAIRLAFRQACAGKATCAPVQPHQRGRRAGIVGAGLVGTALAQEFGSRRELGLRAGAFFDDDRLACGKRGAN